VSADKSNGFNNGRQVAGESDGQHQQAEQSIPQKAQDGGLAQTITIEQAPQRCLEHHTVGEDLPRRFSR
jgi:hypothetical protein